MIDYLLYVSTTKLEIEPGIEIIWWKYINNG